MGLGSGIQKKTYSVSRIPVQGSKRHRIPDPGSRIRIRNTAFYVTFFTSPVFNLLEYHIFFMHSLLYIAYMFVMQVHIQYILYTTFVVEYTYTVGVEVHV
jgi:hypothetical protein